MSAETTASAVQKAVIAERARAAAHAREGYRYNFRCDDIALRILSGEAAADSELPRALSALSGGVLPDPKGGCVCEPFEQSAGGIYTELLLDYEPSCPVHSRHVYDPQSGTWIIDPRAESADWRVLGGVIPGPIPVEWVQVGDTIQDHGVKGTVSRIVRNGRMRHVYIDSGHVSFAKVAQQDFITVLRAGGDQ